MKFKALTLQWQQSVGLIIKNEVFGGSRAACWNCSDSLGNLATRNPWPVKLNTVGIFEGFLQFILATTLAFNHL